MARPSTQVWSLKSGLRPMIDQSLLFSTSVAAIVGLLVGFFLRLGFAQLERADMLAAADTFRAAHKVLPVVARLARVKCHLSAPLLFQ